MLHTLHKGHVIRVLETKEVKTNSYNSTVQEMNKDNSYQSFLWVCSIHVPVGIKTKCCYVKTLIWSLWGWNHTAWYVVWSLVGLDKRVAGPPSLLKTPALAPVCGKGCLHKGDLNRHMMTHTGEKLFSCSVCDKGCLKKSHLKVHMTTHNSKSPCLCSMWWRLC